jgi:hypothetical chaperone protein
MIACGLDFGTSNSAIGVARGDSIDLAVVENDKTLIPSAIFFDYETKGRIAFGNEAIESYVGQTDGRLMRALKSILGSPLIDETTALGGRNVAFTEVIEIFIRHLKGKAEAASELEVAAVVHGRPVRFVDGDDAADARAEATLRSIARRVGFRHVEFVFEPIAAAYEYEATIAREEIVLIADIGGGTSDFTVIRVGPNRRFRPDRTDDILANSGVHIGGADFDALLSLDAVMPLLGLGMILIEKNLPMPKALYIALSNWATINFAYTPRNEREVKSLVTGARAPEKVGRLLKVLRHHLGHRIAMEVEQAKIMLSSQAKWDISLEFVEAELNAMTSRDAFDQAILGTTERLAKAATACIASSGLTPDRIDAIFLTGGSSKVPAIRNAITRAAPLARSSTGDDLLSVAMGLTREAARRFG